MLTFKLFKVVAFIYSIERVPRTHEMPWPSSQAPLKSSAHDRYATNIKHTLRVHEMKSEQATVETITRRRQFQALSARQI